MIRFRKCLSAFSLGALFLGGCTTSASAPASLDVKEKITYELGDEVTLEAKDFVENADDSVLKDVKISSAVMNDSEHDYNDFNNAVTDKGKGYLGLGEYKVTIEYETNTYTSTIEVVDTTPPQFISSPRSVVVPVGDENFDPNTRFRVSDKDENTTLELVGDYDLNTPGIYSVEVVASDSSGNRNSLDISLKVISGDQVISPIDQQGEQIEDLTPSDSGFGGPNESSSLSSSEQSETPAESLSSEESSSSQSEEQQSEPSSDQSGESTACSASHVEPNQSYYYSFDEMYAAGTAWNNQAPNNYFLYLIGTDDCGNQIYILSTGSGSDGFSSEDSQESKEESKEGDQNSDQPENKEKENSDHGEPAAHAEKESNLSSQESKE